MIDADNPMAVLDDPVVAARCKLFRRLRDTEVRLWVELAGDINRDVVRHGGMSEDRAKGVIKRVRTAALASENTRAAGDLLNELGVWP